MCVCVCNSIIYTVLDDDMKKKKMFGMKMKMKIMWSSLICCNCNPTLVATTVNHLRHDKGSRGTAVSILQNFLSMNLS